MIKHLEIITLFPEMFAPLMETAVFQRGSGKVKIEIVNLREFSQDKHRTVDDTPYGGGCGMILKPEPIAGALESFKKKSGNCGKIIYLSPQGSVFSQDTAHDILNTDSVALLCGRYEGIDERIIDLYVDMEISIGDFVLSGGEIPAMVVAETVLRLVPGVLGNEESARTDSFSDGLLKYPQYTRPEKFNGLSVPAILLSGDHGKISSWRREEALKRTKLKRPDLFLKMKDGSVARNDGPEHGK